jgi:DNA-binding PadR family transcriptional regulator
MEELVLTDAELIVLGMLYEKPQHGYDLDKLIKMRGVRNWANIGFSSVYYILNKLEKKGCVMSDPAENGPRRSYSITKSGSDICRQNTKQLFTKRVSPKNPFMVGIANSYMLSKDEIKASLADRRKQLDNQLSLLAKMQEAQQPLPEHAAHLFSYSQAMIKAEIEWIDKINKEASDEDKN